MPDLLDILGADERLKRVGGTVVGESDATLFEIFQDLLASAFEDTPTLAWSYNDTLNKHSAEVLVDDDDTLSSGSTTVPPSTRAVKEYVDNNVVAGGGDISSGDASVTGWNWVVFAADPATSTDTKVPTWAKVVNLATSLSVPAQLASTDTDIIDIYVDVSTGVTYLDVSAITLAASANFSTDTFRVVDELDNTKEVAFSVASVTTGTTRTISVPNADGTLVLHNNAQTLSNKKLADLSSILGQSAFGLDFDPSVANPLRGPTVFGYAGAPGGIAAHHTGSGGTATYVQSGSSAEIFRLAARPTIDTLSFATVDAFQLGVFMLEAPTAAAQGTSIRFAVTRVGSVTRENIFALIGGVDAYTVGTVNARGAMLIGSGDATSRPSAGYALESKHSGGIGYGTGAGGTVTQATSKATGVTLSKPSGQITMSNAALAAGTIVSFVLTNTILATGDTLTLNHVAGGTLGAYSLNAACGAGVATIYVRNNTGGSLSEAIVIGFYVNKGALT